MEIVNISELIERIELFFNLVNEKKSSSVRKSHINEFISASKKFILYKDNSDLNEFFIVHTKQTCIPLSDFLELDSVKHFMITVKGIKNTVNEFKVLVNSKIESIIMSIEKLDSTILENQCSNFLSDFNANNLDIDKLRARDILEYTFILSRLDCENIANIIQLYSDLNNKYESTFQTIENFNYEESYN